MDLSDATGLSGVAALVLLLISAALAIAMTITDHLKKYKCAAILRGLVKITLIFSGICWVLAGMLMFAAMSQSAH